MCLCGGAHLFHQLIRQIIKIEFHTHSHRHCECPAIIFFLWRIFRSRFQFNCVANWYVRIHWYPQILITNILIGNIRIHLEWEKQSTSQIASIIRSLSLSPSYRTEVRTRIQSFEYPQLSKYRENSASKI